MLWYFLLSCRLMDYFVCSLVTLLCECFLLVLFVCVLRFVYIFDGLFFFSHLWSVQWCHQSRFWNIVEFKPLRLTSSPPFTDCLWPLKSRRVVATLSIFSRYFHANWSLEFVNCIFHLSNTFLVHISLVISLPDEACQSLVIKKLLFLPLNSRIYLYYHKK